MSEGAISKIKRWFYRIMERKRVLKRVWNYIAIWVSETGKLSVSISRYANGQTRYEIVTGETQDIIKYIDFWFYDWMTYQANAGLGELIIGRWLGVSQKVRQLVSYWIITISVNFISCVNDQRLTESKQSTDEYLL